MVAPMIDSRSRSGIRRARWQRYTVVLFLAAAAVGCGEDPVAFDRATAIASFSDANDEATDAQSACVVDRLIDRYGLERLETELRADPPKAEFAEVQFRDMFACGIEGDVRAQIVEQLQANDVAEADAPCVADALMANLEDDDFDVLLSGDITDSFFAKFVSAMEDCGAINS